MELTNEQHDKLLDKLIEIIASCGIAKSQIAKSNTHLQPYVYVTDFINGSCVRRLLAGLGTDESSDAYLKDSIFFHDLTLNQITCYHLSDQYCFENYTAAINETLTQLKWRP